MEIISTFSALSFGEKRRKLSKGGSFALCDNTNSKLPDLADEKKPFSLPSNLPFRLATSLLRLCGPESGFSFSRPESCPVFGCIARPSLSLTEYAKRLDQLVKCSGEIFVVAAILIHRMYASVPELFCELSTHRILGTALVIACKFCEDNPESNSFYAGCLGTNAHDLNQMERHFLQHIQYRVFVSAAQFEQTGSQLAAIGTRSKYHASRNKTAASAPFTNTPNNTSNNNNTTVTSTNNNNCNNNTNITNNKIEEIKKKLHTPQQSNTPAQSQQQQHARQLKRKFKEDN